MPGNSITKGGRHWNPATAAGMLLAIAAIATATDWRARPPHLAPAVPEPTREFRGVWIATVYNLDWPSKPGLPVETQQAELLEILDGAAALHLNAVVLQVRTMCDALYASPLEPWSYYLTGELGKAPEPFWDPLEFAVREAHARGLELHAWFNPFRATTAEYGPVVPENHISRQYPWVTRASGRHLWLDPSSEFVRNRAIAVIFDVVSRYDVDAVHLDDYFYPYPAKGSSPDFDDDENWDRYRLGEGLAAPDGPATREDWRRELVNRLIEDLYGDIKRAKPWVKLGLSPFGIWRPGYPEKIKGMDAYSQIYADSRKWLREGWVDYFSPQLYWKNEGPQSFPALYRWWQGQNVHGRHLWPGLATSRIGRGGEADGRAAGDVFAQIAATRAPRGRSSGSGQLHWHWEAFVTDRGGIRKTIAAKPYADRALPPPSPWLAKLAGADGKEGSLPVAGDLALAASPAHHALIVDEEGNPIESDDPGIASLEWFPESGDTAAVRWWLVQCGTRKASAWTWRAGPLVPGTDRHARLESAEGVDAIAVRAVDAYGGLGPVRLILRETRNG